MLPMLKYVLITSLLLSSSLANGQVRQLRGLVVYDNQRLSDASVKNLNTKNKTFSNERGEFAITGKPGDTLTVAKDGFPNDTVSVNDPKYIVVDIHKKPALLREVTINAAPLSPLAVYAANEKEYKLIYFWGDKSGIFTAGTMFTINVDKLNNLLGKRGRDSRRLQRTLTGDYKNSVVDKRFNPLAARITGYKDKELTEFIQNNRPSYAFVSRASDYDIVKYIKSKLAEKPKANARNTI